MKGVRVTVVPDEKGVAALAKYVRETGRAYPLVDIAKAMLSSRDRYALRFEKGAPKGEKGKRKKSGGRGERAKNERGPEGEEGRTRLFRCVLDESLWITREEALRHAARCDGVSSYYRVDEVEVEPPKGNFQVVAVHEKTGTILGPPNHHEYQSNLAKLHRERFGHLPFEKFSRMMEMRRDEETLEKWRELKSKARHYTYVFGQEVAVDEAEISGSEEVGEDGSEDAVLGDEPGAEEVVDESTAGEADGDVEAGGEEGEAEVEAVETADKAEGEESAGDAEGAEEGAAVSDDGSDEERQKAGAAEGDEAESEDGATEGEEEAPGGTEEVVAVEGEGGDGDTLVFKTEEEMARHFAATHGDEVVEEVQEAVVKGDIPGRDLSPQLLSLLRQAVDEQRKFPSGLIQELCRAVEKEGLKIFKEGRKKLHVSPARPTRLDPKATLTEPIEKIVSFIRENPGAKVVDLLESIIPGYERPAKDAGEWKPSKEELSVLKELHWLTSQGYVIEFSSSKLRMAGMGPGRPEENRKGTGAEKAVNPKKGRERSGARKGKKERGATEAKPEVVLGEAEEAMRVARSRKRRKRLRS